MAKRTCECGTCKKCRGRESQRRYWHGLSKERQAALKASWPSQTRESQRVYDNARNKLPERMASLIARSKKWAKAHPLRRRAQHAVNNATRDGKMSRKPCEVCGRIDSKGHHDDYTKPLDVRWLCPIHHARAPHKEPV